MLFWPNIMLPNFPAIRYSPWVFQVIGLTKLQLINLPALFLYFTDAKSRKGTFCTQRMFCTYVNNTEVYAELTYLFLSNSNGFKSLRERLNVGAEVVK